MRSKTKYQTDFCHSQARIQDFGLGGGPRTFFFGIKKGSKMKNILSFHQHTPLENFRGALRVIFFRIFKGEKQVVV